MDTSRSGRRQGIPVLVLGIALLVGGTRAAPAAAPRLIKVDRGTNLAATVSPDRSSIVFDLQGVLWSIPMAGGSATPLTQPLLEPARPDYAPSGGLIAFEAYAGGTFHIWTMDPNGQNPRQLTSGHADDRDPRVSPDGTRIAYSSDGAIFGSNYTIQVLDLGSGQSTTRASSTSFDQFEPTWSPDGDTVAFVSGTGANGTSVQAVDSKRVRTTLVTAPARQRLNSPAYSPSGNQIAYVQFGTNATPAGPVAQSQLWVKDLVTGATTRVGTSDDVFPFYPVWLSETPAARLLYTADGKIQISTAGGGTSDVSFEATFPIARDTYTRKKFDFDSRAKRPVVGVVGPALSPDARRVAFEALNQIWVMEIGKKPRAITADSYYKCDPAWSPDGSKIAYSSDKDGIMKVYVYDTATRGGDEQPVTEFSGAQVSAAWSHDGSKLAFQDQNGATFYYDFNTRTVHAVGAPPPGSATLNLFAPSKPSWSYFGNTIAIGALKPYTRRFREGTSQILTVDVATGALTYNPTGSATGEGQYMSLSTRGEDGPVYSPDGTAMALVMESNLWIRPVDRASGTPSGAAVRINTEVTDAPTWSGDSQQLLYLSNGKLRLIPRSGGRARDVELDLAWRPDQPSGRTVVHAGRLWDGRGPDQRTNVDIVIEGNRIESVRPHRDRPQREENEDGDETRFIDASRQTVIPGLWESHTHEYISGKFYGDRLGRLWMAYGVTTLNSVGDPAYRAVETRESFASGDRVGPRYFATGEAIDGERVFYNFMRPTTSAAQLERELSRGKALGYDMVKTYVRLQHDWQLRSMQVAHHEMGVWVASHYMLPGLAFGMDGQTHVSATTRLGFAYTRSSGGISYPDMRDLFRLSGMLDISTTFSPTLYSDDPAMVADPRLQALNTPWDQALLVAKAAAATANPLNGRDALQKEEDTFAFIQQNSGTMLAGTDSPLDNVATALHLNLRAQVQLGHLPPWRALQSATRLPAETFSVGKDLGTIEPGKLADLAFVGDRLSDDPLQDIKKAADVKAVMKNGRYYTVAELMAPFLAPTGPATPRSIQRAISAPRHPSGDKWWHDPEQMIEDEHK